MQAGKWVTEHPSAADGVPNAAASGIYTDPSLAEQPGAVARAEAPIISGARVDKHVDGLDDIEQQRR